MKNLIIVCDEKRKEYANYLLQLISVEDDTEESTIGVKDGSVQARVWLEKDFEANSATLSSNQYVVFIGNGKLFKEQRNHMNPAFSDFGMVCSKLGHRAAIYVEHPVLGRYGDFISYAQKYEKKLKNVLGEKGWDSIYKTPTRFIPIIGPIMPLVKILKIEPKIKDQMYSCAIMKFYLEELNKFLGLE